MSKRASETVSGLAPEIRFGEDFLQRLESFVPRIVTGRERVEGSGRSSLATGGEEFVGYRPYRPGEDLRQLDWNLLARLDRPFVRTTRREASESWTLLLDASASMAVGPPGKWQLAGELAVALARVGVQRGARVTCRVAGAPQESAEFVLHRGHALPELMSYLEGLRADRRVSLSESLHRLGTTSGRIFVISDFCGVDPAELLAHSSRGRSVCALQLLAPRELRPLEQGWIEWHDPESAEEMRVHVDRRLVRDYESRLQDWISSWRDSCARHRAAYGVWSSEVAFEEILSELLGT